MKARLLAISLFLALTISQTAIAEPDSWYTDVEENHQYRDAILYITDAEFASGYEDGTFKPQDPINRAEVLKIILNSSYSESSYSGSGLTFTDVSESDWFYALVQEGVASKIINGYEDNTFKPGHFVNRAEFLKMFLNANQVVASSYDKDSDWYQKFIDYALTNGLMSSENAGEQMNRGEVAEIIYRFNENSYTGFYEYGKTSWYHGDTDDIYEAEKGMTAAHKTLDFGTRVKVTNLDTNLSVVVKINDRGPFIEGRIIDLTDIAFEKIGSLGSGVLNTKLEVLK